MTSVHPNLNPEAIFERGFVTHEEAKSVDLATFCSKVNLEDSAGEYEGIFVAFITEEDRKKYNNDSSVGEDIRGVLLNHAVCFYPSRSLGRVVVGKTSGSTRPVFKAADQVEHLAATQEAYLKEYAPKEAK